MKTPAPGQPPQYNGAIDVVRKVMRAEGARGLYAGIQAPLPFVAVFNATLFASNGAMRRVIGQGRSEEELSIAELGLAGVGAGAAVSFVACPTELVKCRLQAQPGVFSGAIDCTKQVLASRGLAGLFVGMRATVIREMIGNSFYFMSYTAMLRAMTPAGKSTADLNASQYLLAGGIAGLGAFACHFLACPFAATRPLRPTNSSGKRASNHFHCALFLCSALRLALMWHVQHSGRRAILWTTARRCCRRTARRIRGTED